MSDHINTKVSAFAIMDWAFAQTGLSVYAKTVLVHLVKHINTADLSCFPSWSRLMEQTGIKSKSTLAKALQELEQGDQPIIRREERYRMVDGRPRKSSSKFTLLHPDVFPPIGSHSELTIGSHSELTIGSSGEPHNSIINSVINSTPISPKGNDGSGRSKNDHCPYDEILDLCKTILPAIRHFRKANLTEKRKKQIRALWQNSERLPDMKNWKSYFEYCAQIDFLAGRTDWKPDLEFLTRESTYCKIEEGFYADQQNKRRNGNGV